MIEDFAKLIPESLLDKSGKVFYSGRKAFEAPKELYILGANPGGAPEDYVDETVSSHTQKALNSKPYWSEYTHGRWGRGRKGEKHLPGEHRLQKRMRHLLNGMRLNPGEVPASNLIFLRSARLETLSEDWEQLAEKCWQFHQAVIEYLGVRVVVCLGQDTGNWVCYKLNAECLVDRFKENNKRE